MMLTHNSYRCTNALSVGLSLLLTVFTPVVLGSIAWLLAYGMAWWMFPAGVAAALAAAWLMSRSPQAPVIMLAYITASVLFAGLIFDYAADSLGYHKPAVCLLAEGWIPLDYHHYPDTTIWVLHYAKFLEISASAIYAFTGLLEQGKAVNLLLAGSLAAISYDTLRNMGLDRKKCLAVILVLLCNPVLTTQIFTFYIDFSLYVYLSLTCLLLINIHMRHHHRLSCMALLMVTLMAMGTKFNIFFYQGLALIVGLGWFLLKKDSLAAKYVIIAGTAALGAGAVIFYHPYFTNWLGWGNPLYPLLGAGSVDIMTGNTPELFQGHIRVVNFLLNLFCMKSRNFPFTNYDGRMSGFTILGGIILVMALAILARGWKKFPPTAYFMAAVILLSCFCFEQSWWARYIPQFWLIPAIAIFCRLKYTSGGHAFTRVFLAMVICAFLLSGAAQFYMLFSRSL